MLLESYLKNKPQTLKATMSELNFSADPLDILKAQLEELEIQEPEIITAPKIFYEDVSSEAFAYHIAIGHPSASLWSDEGGLFVASNGMKEDNAMGMFAIINRIWDGNDFEPTRKTAKTKRISGRRCTANIMLQQTVFEKWQGKQNDMSRAIGTSARFLTQRPKSTMGEREYQAPPERTPKMQTFHDRVRNIMETPLPMDDEGRLMPPVLQLSEEAKRIWTAYFNKVEESLKQGGEFAEVKDFASKTAEQAARISGVLHVFEFGPEGEIQPETMLQSINIAEWYLHEANRIFVTARLPEEFKNAFILQKWIKNYCQLSQLSQLSQGLILKEGPNQLRNKTIRDNALKILEEHGAVILITEGKKKIIKVNPKLLEDSDAAKVAKVAKVN